MSFIPSAELDPLRKELSEVFWDHLFRDKLEVDWITVLRLMEMSYEDKIPVMLINRREVSLSREMREAFQETELVIDKMYFAMFKYPKFLPKEP